jgi:hypothetical protein
MPTPRVERTSDTTADLRIGEATVASLDAKAVTELIGALVAVRAAMTPPAIATDPRPHDLILSSPGQMRWRLAATPDQERPVALMLGHPGLGWTALSLPERGVENMIGRLQQALRHVRGLPPE